MPLSLRETTMPTLTEYRELLADEITTRLTGSTPADEDDEALMKSSALLRALEIALGTPTSGGGSGGSGSGDAIIDDRPLADIATDRVRSNAWLTAAFAGIYDDASTTATDKTWSAARITEVIADAVAGIGGGAYTPPPHNNANAPFP
jgi:hypothetical protein